MNAVEVLPLAKIRMPLPIRSAESSPLSQAAFGLLLVVGLYFPSSINAEHSTPAILAAFVLLVSLLIYLAWDLGLRWQILAFISIPMTLLPLVCTFFRSLRVPLDFDAGLFLKFSALALVIALNLRDFRLGKLVRSVFVMANLVNIACGAAVLVGNEWIADFLPSFYWTSDGDLVPLMVSLHKPILTFGSHALAGLFTYLFFWVNWEDYALRKNRLSLWFALCYFVLLLGLASFTSLGFAVLAAGQAGAWAWKRGRKFFIGFSLGVAALVLTTASVVAGAMESAEDLPQLAEMVFLNGDRNGPLSRYSPEGTLHFAESYLFARPFSPIGLARSANALDVGSEAQFFVGDSGPLEYALRGSLPLLFLVYFGFGLFLRSNLIRASHWTTLFIVVVVFETGFSALTSSRTLFLLPFFVVYLNHTASAPLRQPRRGIALSEYHALPA